MAKNSGSFEKGMKERIDAEKQKIRDLVVTFPVRKQKYILDNFLILRKYENTEI